MEPEIKIGAEIMWECLIHEGVEVVFGYPGAATLPAYGVLDNYEGKIRHVLTRHEQGATHMADGYARASGKVGVAMSTSGPGATNMVTGLATAMRDASPLVCITGQVATTAIGGDAFQEVDMVGVTQPITKHNYPVSGVDELAQTIHEAFYIARTGRPGPVLIDIPKDILTTATEFEYPAEPVNLPGYHVPASIDTLLETTLEMLDIGLNAANSREAKQFESSPSPAAQVVQKIQENVRGDAFIITDIGPHQVYVRQNKGYMPNDADGTGTIGFGLPAAIGASFHTKDRDIWVIVDQDSVQATITELGTAAQENVNINIVILKNRSAQWSDRFYEKTPINGPDYVKLAEAYGLPGYRVDKLEDVRPTLQKAGAHNGPVIIEFAVEQHETGYAMMPIGVDLNQMIHPQPQFENMEI